VKHEDFTSLDVEKMLEQVVDFCRTQSQARAVHWISAHGLHRIVMSSNENWQWAFASVDIVGKHLLSKGPEEKFDLFHTWQLWHHVTELHPGNWPAAMTPKSLTFENQPLMIWPVFGPQGLLGVLAFEGLPSGDCPAKVTSALQKGLTLATRYLGFAYELMEAKNLSSIDELTGLYNQRHLPLVLAHEIERCRREKSHFCLLFLDIDYFKMVNDGRGHWVGSKLLGELAKVLSTQVRTCDHAFRYGGDEFIVLLGGADVEVAKKVAERIRKAVEAHSFFIEGHDLKLTVSIGLAEYPTHAQSAEQLIQLADQAMYYGKRKSRNIVFIAS
jgi:diguanylate cyclase (GGDEF)-like protein